MQAQWEHWTAFPAARCPIWGRRGQWPCRELLLGVWRCLWPDGRWELGGNSGDGPLAAAHPLPSGPAPSRIGARTSSWLGAGDRCSRASAFRDTPHTQVQKNFKFRNSWVLSQNLKGASERSVALPFLKLSVSPPALFVTTGLKCHMWSRFRFFFFLTNKECGRIILAIVRKELDWESENLGVHLHPDFSEWPGHVCWLLPA